MALPTVNVTAEVDPKPIAHAIAESLAVVIQPLVDVLNNVGGGGESPEDISDEMEDASKLADDVANQQLEAQLRMADRLEGIFNFTKETSVATQSTSYDGVKQRKVPEKLDAIREAIIAGYSEMPVVAVGVPGKSAETSLGEQADAIREQVEGEPDSDDAADGIRHYTKETADNTKEILDIMRGSAQEQSEEEGGLDDDGGDKVDDDGKPAKEAKEKKKDGPLSGAFKAIGDFAKLVTKVFTMIALLAAAVFAADDGFFTKLKELFGRLIEVLAPVVQTIMEDVLPPILDLFITVADMFMQIVEMLMPPILKIIQDVMPPIMALFTTLAEVFMQIVEMLMPHITRLIDELLPPIVELFMTLLDVFMQLVELLMPALEPIIGFITDVAINVISLIANILTSVLKFFSDPIGYLQDGISYIADGGDMILSGIGSFINGLIEFIAGLVEKIPFVGESAAEGLRSLKVSFGDAAEERMARRAQERANRAADRVVDEVDFSQSKEDFKASLDQKVADGDMSEEVAGILMQRYDEQNETGDGSGSGSQTDATSVDTTLASVDVKEMADGLVQVPAPAQIGSVKAGDPMFITKTPQDGKFIAYDKEGTPLGAISADSSAGQLIAKLAEQEGVPGQVAQDSAIDGTSIPPDVAELPTGSVALNTAGQAAEEEQLAAQASGDNVSISPVVSNTDASTRVVNNQTTTGVIYTPGGSSLGGRDGILPA